MCLKHYGRMANGAGPDQTAPAPALFAPAFHPILLFLNHI